MPTPQEVYPVLLLWLRACVGLSHPTAAAALAHLVTALLIGQSLRPSALMRALVSPQPVPARQRYRRVARAWTRPWLSPAWLTPRLVQAARTLVPGERRLVLDSVRCGGWEVFTVGLLWHGRGLPVVPWHQRGPASQRARQQQAAQRDRDLATKRRRAIRRPAPETDRWVVLFTTHGHWWPAVTAYRRRWATEGTYRDGQGGWD